MDLKALIREVPDFPKPGILFRDITTLLQNEKGLRYVIDSLTSGFADQQIEYVAGIESRGFIFGAPLAYSLRAGFVPIRKPGKLCAAVNSVEYALEYGTDRLEMHQDAIPTGARVLIVDDLMATGGTAAAAAQLVQQTGAELVSFAFIIELTDLGGRKHLPNVPIKTLVEY
ncbi:MAG: adenine phosphoribosyltransferase [Aphanocapsa sp. GSE-SYN-MK-11-07L]|jgi:adenine phosphoribosyltransferase|nr:adenine phosphoribosyltransferase [Aphanocapsa sp. GSE-SYN-MK-11-07L]